jgi:hypothetical protein
MRAGLVSAFFIALARWPSGKAEACKAFIPGSNPGLASKRRRGHPAGCPLSFAGQPGARAADAPATAGDCAATRRRACTFGSYGRPPAPSLGPAARPDSSLPRRNPSHSAFSQVATTYRSAPWPGPARDPSITSETATISAGNCGGGAQAANRAETPGTSRGSESGSVRECAAWGVGRGAPAWDAGRVAWSVRRGAGAWGVGASSGRRHERHAIAGGAGGGGRRHGTAAGNVASRRGATRRRGQHRPPGPAATSAASPAARPCPGRSA